MGDVLVYVVVAFVIVGVATWRVIDLLFFQQTPLKFRHEMKTLVVFETFLDKRGKHRWRIVLNEDTDKPDVVVTSNRAFETRAGCIIEITTILHGVRSDYAIDEIVAQRTFEEE